MVWTPHFGASAVAGVLHASRERVRTVPRSHVVHCTRRAIAMWKERVASVDFA
jgi:hypothetical protein